MKAFVNNIEKLSLSSNNFRKVLNTGQHSQLVLMSLLPNEDIGTEVHDTIDQFIRIEKGEGKVIIDGQEHPLTDGSAVIIPAGSKHNIINSSSKYPLKLYTLYSPPHHKDGTLHKTKQESEKDTADHR